MTKQVHIIRSPYGIEGVYGSKRAALTEARILAGDQGMTVSDWDDNRWVNGDDYFAVESHSVRTRVRREELADLLEEGLSQ